MTLANEIISSFRNFRTFTFNDVRIALTDRHEKISDKTIQVTLSRMVKEGRAHAVMKGVFSLEKKDEVVGFAFTPFYYGGLAALMIRDIIDDQVKMEIMTTRRVRKSFLDVYDGSSKVVVHHIPRSYYFGFEDLKYGNITVPVSNPEKTLIDLFYYKEKLSVQNYAGLLKIIRKGVLREYLKRYDKHTRTAVMKSVVEYGQLRKSNQLNIYY